MTTIDTEEQKDAAYNAITRMAETAGPFSTRTYAVKAIVFAILALAGAVLEVAVQIRDRE